MACPVKATRLVELESYEFVVVLQFEESLNADQGRHCPSTFADRHRL